LVEAGHVSVVIAAAGSRVHGRLMPLPRVEPSSESARALVQRAVRRAIAATLARERIDVMHFHGSDFEAYLPPHGPPAVASLHLPLTSYAPAALRPRRPLTWLQPVSANQARSAPPDVILLPPIENGVDCSSFPARRKREFALVFGRVCPEKGFHHAIDACKLAGVPLVAAGTVFPWPEHRRYFAQEIRPRLDAQRRWIGAIAGRRKRRLLAAARCVLVPSTAAETSSLVAMEALAAGTPVIAYPSGALPEICRRRARERFALQRTIVGYLALYERLKQIGNAAFSDGMRSA
jgi:glycosyltransferase involved in cell wall biosynthesis